MRYLIDTHVFVWMDSGEHPLPPEVASILADKHHVVLVSHVCIWELAIKASIGKLRPRKPLAELVALYTQSRTVEFLPISIEHILRVEHLPRHHGDPFDRLIAAQALAEDLPLLTADNVYERYGVRRVWD